MMNENIMRGTENVSSMHNLNQSLGTKLKGVGRFKANALGDVRNILHSRTTNLLTKLEKSNSTKFLATRQNENVVSCKKIVPEKKTAIKQKKKNNSPKFDGSDIHDHKLCEQADDAYFNNLFKEYKLTEDDIEGLIRRIKPVKFITPKLHNSSFAPCEDINITLERVWDDKDLDLNDTLNDFRIPDICPPEEVL